MQNRAAPPSSNTRFAAWLLLYALTIVYASTVVGPSGLHFVPLDAADAWRDFNTRAFAWVSVGSDQRADWMGNLTMYVPFGFLLAGSLWPRRDTAPNPLAVLTAGCAALALSLAFVLAVKFAQIFFPPRTVMLNYVAAQGIGAAFGIVAYGLSRGRMIHQVWRGTGDPFESFRLVLKLYSSALFVFILMPLDFALGRGELLGQFHRLPDAIVNLPGADRPLVVQAALLVAGAIATVPFGMLLVLGPRARNRSLASATARGFVWMALLWVLSTLLVSGAPALVSLALRTVGITLGAWAMHWLLRQDVDRLLHRLRSLSAWAALPYVVLLFAANGLFSLDWRTPAEAAQSINALGLLPLFDYYIVSKATAARNIVAHAVMYAPIGLFIWLNGARATMAMASALLLALIVEVCRYMRPGLEGDMNAVAVAGAAAYLTARAMPGVWWMLKGVAQRHPVSRG